MSDTPPAPMSPPDCDLCGYDYMPLYGQRLFTSSLYTASSGDCFRTAVRIWWSAWQQRPAGSLPNNDAELAMLADYGRDIKGWKKVKDVVLHGFVLCSDGRLYHPMLCEAAVKAFDLRLKSDGKREKDRERLRNWREAKKKRDEDAKSKVSGNGGGTPNDTPNESDDDAPSETSDETELETRPDTTDETRFTTRSDTAYETPNVIREWKEKESKEESTGLRPGAEAPLTPTQRLWKDGLESYQILADCDQTKARIALGAFRTAANRDDGVVMDAIDEAMREPPANPYPFILAGVKARTSEAKKQPNRKRPPSAPNPDANAWIGNLPDASSLLFDMPIGGNG